MKKALLSIFCSWVLYAASPAYAQIAADPFEGDDLGTVIGIGGVEEMPGITFGGGVNPGVNAAECHKYGRKALEKKCCALYHGTGSALLQCGAYGGKNYYLNCTPKWRKKRCIYSNVNAGW